MDSITKRSDDIIRMAREAGGLNCDCCLPEPEPHEMQEFIERFAALVAEEVRGQTIESEKAGWLYALDKVVKEEREECAKIADNNRHNLEMLTSLPLQSGAARCIAAAIRARGEK